MSRNNLAVKHNGESPQALRIEKAAGNVSGELDKVIHERMRLGIISALARYLNHMEALIKAMKGNK